MAEQPDSGQEKTEQPTPRRLQKARDKGQVARSRELTTMSVLLVAAAGMFALGPGLIEGLTDLMRWGLTAAPREMGDPGRLPVLLERALVDSVLTLAPFLALVALVALLAPLALGGWSFSTQALGFKAERLDPVKGLKRVFGPKGLMELAKALAKFVLVAGFALGLLWMQADAVLSLADASPETALADTAWLLVRSFLGLCLSLMLIAGVDVPFQLWEHARGLRMSRQELKDEFKETEGKPEVKSRIRSLQREAAQRRMMEEVPKADVIVTNPTHYAVALRYQADAMSAPKVVAKGADLLARRIRELGQEHRVAIVSAPPLARALYHSTRLGQEIPAGLYVAVAQILAYVFQLKARPGPGAEAPSPPEDLPIPPELRRDP